MARQEGPQGRCERLWRYRGLWCLAVGWYTLGQRCGYVLLDEDHPWHGLNYQDPVPNPRDRSEDPADTDRVDILALFASAVTGRDHLSTLSGQLDVHGGLTFSANVDWWNDLLEHHDGIPNGWWVGFDAGHAGDRHDLTLLRDPVMREIFERTDSWSAANLRTWTTEDIVKETEHLADQLHQVNVLTAMASQMEEQ